MAALASVLIVNSGDTGPNSGFGESLTGTARTRPALGLPPQFIAVQSGPFDQPVSAVSPGTKAVSVALAVNARHPCWPGQSGKRQFACSRRRARRRSPTAQLSRV